MNMKITRLARGLKCGGLAARRFPDSAAAARVHRSAKARNPKPHEAVLSMSRRGKRPLKSVLVMIGSLIHVTELSRGEQRLAEAGPGGQLRVPLVVYPFQGLAV